MIRKLALVLLFASVGCRGELWDPPPAELIVESKEEFLLRYARKPGQLDRYLASYSVRASGSSWMEEDVEQVIYDETYAFRQWGLYIAAIVLTAKGRKNFTLDDVLQVLRDELIPDLYDTPIVPEKNITLRDVELGRPGDQFRPYACLERISPGVYSYIGFSKARTMRAGR